MSVLCTHSCNTVKILCDLKTFFCKLSLKTVMVSEMYANYASLCNRSQHNSLHGLLPLTRVLWFGEVERLEVYLSLTYLYDKLNKNVI